MEQSAGEARRIPLHGPEDFEGMRKAGRLVAEKPLGDSPARDLRYRVMSRLELPIADTGAGSPASTTSQGAARDRQDVNRPRPPRPGAPRR